MYVDVYGVETKLAKLFHTNILIRKEPYCDHWLRGFNMTTLLQENRSSSVSIVTRMRAVQQGFVPRQELQFFFLLATASRPTLGPTQPPI
jgi:hypothetical protein